MGFIQQIKDTLVHSGKKPVIVFAEGWNKTIYEASKALLNEDLITPLLVFHKETEVPKDIKSKYIVIESTDLSKYSDLLFQLRKEKGMTEEDAKKFVVQPNYLSSLLVKIGEADGEICGIECPTADTYRPALQTIKTAPGVKIASSAILLEKGNESYVFGDVSLNLNPNAEELFNITKAISLFCKDKLKVPNLKVAMLSYSTNGSGKGESVDKVKQAFELVKQDNDLKNINIYGDIQFDAAFDEKVRTKKAPSLNWDGPANAYIFPNLDAGNIAYKIVQRMSNFAAYGPFAIGMAKPVNDLSRGATLEDVIGLSYITALQSL